MRSRVGTPRLAAWIRPPLGLALVVAVVVSVGYARSGGKLKEFRSPDARLAAVVTPVGKEKGFEEYESRIAILRRSRRLRAHDFSSADGEHGYGVDGARWTPNSQFFVCRMRNSGGHSPMYAPVVFWSRKTNRFYQLDAYTADVTFSIAAPDKVNVNTWPDLNPASVSLGHLKEGEARELR
jgi:hypothetical protein